MHYRLIANIFWLLLLAACNVENVEARKSEDMNIKVSLTFPSQLDARTIDPNIVGFSAASNDVSLVFENTSAQPVRVPAFDIVNGVTRIYSADGGKDVREFNISEPPSAEPNLVVIEPGKSWTYGLGFEYERPVYSDKLRMRNLEVCVVWEINRLNRSLYPAASFDWASSFKVCRNADLIYP